MDRVAEGAENDSTFRQFLFESSAHRYAIKHSINGDTGQTLAFLQWDA